MGMTDYIALVKTINLPESNIELCSRKAFYVLIGRGVCQLPHREMYIKSATTVYTGYQERFGYNSHTVGMKHALALLCMLSGRPAPDIDLPDSPAIWMDKRQHNAVIAALRFWQGFLVFHEDDYGPDDEDLVAIAQDGGVKELSVEEIDDLVEELNTEAAEVGL